MVDADSFKLDKVDSQLPCLASDIIVIPASMLGECLTVISRWKAQDKIVLVDLYDLPPDFNQFLTTENHVDQVIKPSWIKSKTSTLDYFRWGLRIVDGIVIHSKPYFDIFSRYTNVFYIPEYLDLDLLSNITPIPHEKIILGWEQDTDNLIQQSTAGMLNALERVFEIRSNIAIHVWDENDHTVEKMIGLRNFEKKKFHIPGGLENHPLAYVDIGLIPVGQASDDCHNWEKALKFMAAKIPWVATDHPTLLEMRPYGWLVQNTETVWERVILDMVDHLTSYQADAAQEAYLFALSQGIEENIERILSTYTLIQHTIKR